MEWCKPVILHPSTVMYRSRILSAALAAWGVCAPDLAPQLRAAVPARPNIVVVLADDLGWAELGCYGQKKIRTPHLDRFAAEGQRWTQFYAGAPVCSPSRNVLLTGCHTGGCSVQDLKRVDPRETADDLKGDWPMKAERPIHRVMRDAGYVTAAFGKWGMGEYGTTGAPDRNGVDEFFGYTDHRMCHSFYPPFLWDNGVKFPLNDPAVPGHSKIPSGPVTYEALTGSHHASVAVIDRVLGFLDKRAGDHKPFFLYYCPLEPHVAMQPPREWVERYPESWDDAPYRGQKGYQPHPRPHAGYAATISFLDENVGRLMAKLREKGLDDSTLVWFTSDNGTTHDVGGVDHGFFESVADLRGLKGSMYEGGIRVPGMLRWPGHVAAGKVVEQPGYAADILPTLSALAGGRVGRVLGENLLPVVLGEKPCLELRRPMVWTGGGYGGQVAVRMGDWKALRRGLYNTKAGPFDWEVYHLAGDRGEDHDLAAERREVVAGAVDVLRREYVRADGYPEMAVFAPETGRRKPVAKGVVVGE